MKRLMPTPVHNDSVTIDLQQLTDLVQQVDRLQGDVRRLQGDVRRLEVAQLSHVEAHRLSDGAGASLGSLATTHPVVAVTAPQEVPAEVEVANPSANSLLVKIASREGVEVESVRAMLSGKRESLPRGKRSAPRGRQFATLREASGGAGIPLTRNVHILRQLVRPHGQYPTLYGAIKAGVRVRIT